MSLRLRGRRADQARAFVLLAATTASLLTAAFRSEGNSTTEVSLHDAGIWVTHHGEGWLGRVNTQIDLIDSRRAFASRDFDVHQSDALVLVHEVGAGQLNAIDVRLNVIAGQGRLPEGSRVALGGTTGAVLAGDGRLWVGPGDQLPSTDFDEPPSAVLAGTSALAVGVDGTAHGIGSDDAALVSVAPGVPPQPPVPLPKGLGDVQVTAVGAVPVVLDTGSEPDATTAVLHLPGQEPVDVSSYGENPVLQQPGGEADDVLLATDTGLVLVPLAGGEPRVVFPEGTGSASAPVALGGCAFGAWSGKPAYAQVCGDEVVSGAFDSAAAGSRLTFRVNRGAVLLNETATGANLLFSDEPPQRVDDWSTAAQADGDGSQEDTDEAKAVEEEADKDVARENRPPTANDDAFATRPGRPVVLRPLGNDTDPDGDVLVVEPLPPLPDGTGTLALVEGGQAVQLTPAADSLAPVSFDYTVDDGRGGRDTARISVAVKPEQENEPPVTRTDRVVVEAGRSVTHDVLVNDADPEGDTITLVGVAAPEGTVQYRSNGEVTFTAPGGGARVVDVTYSATDEYGAISQGQMRVDVRSQGTNLPPLARSDRAAGVVGDEIVLEVLSNDVDPNGDALTVVRVDQPAGLDLRWEPDGTVRMTAARPGTTVLAYEISDGGATDEGIVRVDVVETGDPHAPVAVRDDVVLPAGVATPVDVLANDLDVDGDVLVVQQVQGVPEGSGLVVEVVDRRLLRLTAATALPTPLSFTYTVSDGTATAVGTVRVRPAPDSGVDQPPVTAPDERTLRAGNTVGVRVLDNDVDPEGGVLTLVSVEEPTAGDGEAFVQGREVRFRAPDEERGSVTVRYRVRDVAGNVADGVLVLRVTPRDGARNAAPVPPPVVARVFAGRDVEVVLPLVGMDPDGDPVTLLGLVEAPSQGSVELTGPATFTYSADRRGAGTDRFTYRVRDPYGAEAVGTVRVGVVPPPQVNSAPVAVADRVVVRPGRTVRIDVLRNDSDPDGDAISLLEGVEGVGRPRVGEVVQDGSVLRYTAPADLEADVETSFDYGIDDGRGGRARGLVTVRMGDDVPDQPPVARDDLAVAHRAGAPVDIALLDNDEDVDGDLSAATVTVSGVDGATAEGGRLRFTMPDEAVTLVYVLTDEQGLSARAVVQVPLLGNLPPRAGADVARTDVDVAVPVDVLANDSDPEGEPLQLLRVVQARNGTAQAEGARVVFTPAAGFVGEAGFTYEVGDGLESAVGTVVVTVVGAPETNAPPVFTQLPVQVTAGGSSTLSLSGAVSDLDPEDTHTFSGVTGAPDGVTATLGGDRGSQLTISADVAAAGRSGRLALSVDDGKPGGRVEGVVVLTVTSTTLPPPQAVSDTGQTAQEQPVTLSVLDNDVDPVGRGLTVESVTAPTAGSTSTDGRRITFTPANGFFGSTTFSYTVADGSGDAQRRSVGSVTVAVIGRPSAPAAPSGTVSSRRVDLTWGAPAANGAPITEYVVEDDDGGSRVCSGNACAIESLRNGTPYRFRVLARNAAGDSEWSDWSAELVPDALPGVPAAPTARYGDRQIAVTWSEPRNDGSSITEYRLQITPSPGGTGVQTVPGGTTSYTWAGLSNGTAYSFRVQAVNRAGESDFGPTSTPEVPAGVPATPAPPQATRGDSLVQVAWQAPDGNGDAVAGYELVVIRSGSVERSIEIADGSTSTSVPAANASSYTFELRARNKVGWSQASAPSAAVVPAGRPGSVQAVSATGGDTTASLSFSAPDDNGSAITSYTVSVNGGAPGTLAADRVVRGLANGTDYTFRVAACNDVGCGEMGGASGSVNPFGTPAAPGVTASVNGRSISWSWNTPDGNGRPIVRFDVFLNGHLIKQDLGTSHVQEFGYAENHVVTVHAVNDGDRRSAGGSAGGRTVDPPPRTVSIERGDSAYGVVTNGEKCVHSSCRWVRVTIRNFPANASFSGTCRENGADWFPFTITTDSSGSATKQPCYYGYPGRTVSVVVDGVESNHIPW